jgi:hypothetical protein
MYGAVLFPRYFFLSILRILSSGYIQWVSYGVNADAVYTIIVTVENLIRDGVHCVVFSLGKKLPYNHNAIL